MKFFLFVFFFLIFVFVSPTTFATEQLSPEEYNLALMESNAFAQCYTQQDGDALFIFSSSGKITDQTKMAKLFCDRKYYQDIYPSKCVESAKKKIITLSKDETACNYAPDAQKCNTCAMAIGLQRDVAHYGFLGLFGLFLFLPSISFFYLLVIGGIYLFKKRLLGPKWLLIITSMVFILSILSLLYFEL